MDYDHTMLWKGVPLDECTRDQLLECARDYFRRNAEFSHPTAAYERALGHVERLKREAA